MTKKIKKAASKAARVPTSMLETERPEPETPRLMGLGELGRSDLVFGRKFRWTLEGAGLPEHYAMTVSIDYVNRILQFRYMDVTLENQGYHALAWCDKIAKGPLENETLRLKTFSGTGHLMLTVVFKGLELLEHVTDFDYASSDVSSHLIKVKYRHVEKTVTPPRF
jgi:hypothetical protein